MMPAGSESYMSVHAASCRYAYPSNSILLTACSLSLGELGGGACSDLGFEQDPGYTWCAEMVTSGLTQLCCISRSTLIPTSPDTCRPGRSTRRNHSVPVLLCTSTIYVNCMAIPNLMQAPPSMTGAAPVKSSPRSRSRLERLKARGRWKLKAHPTPTARTHAPTCGVTLRCPVPDIALTAALTGRASETRPGYATVVLNEVTKGQISLAWVSPRTRRVAQFDLSKHATTS